MSGPAHYAEAERLLEHAASMLATDVAPEDRAELVQRQAAVASMATAHAVLAPGPQRRAVVPDAHRPLARGSRLRG